MTQSATTISSGGILEIGPAETLSGFTVGNGANLVALSGGTLNNDSRKKFDAFLKELINGNEKYPKPKNVKLSKVVYYDR